MPYPAGLVGLGWATPFPLGMGCGEPTSPVWCAWSWLEIRVQVAWDLPFERKGELVHQVSECHLENWGDGGRLPYQSLNLRWENRVPGEFRLLTCCWLKDILCPLQGGKYLVKVWMDVLTGKIQTL
jgi:hypothetical protein